MLSLFVSHSSKFYLLKQFHLPHKVLIDRLGAVDVLCLSFKLQAFSFKQQVILLAVLFQVCSPQQNNSFCSQADCCSLSNGEIFSPDFCVQSMPHSIHNAKPTYPKATGLDESIFIQEQNWVWSEGICISRVQKCR